MNKSGKTKKRITDYYIKDPEEKKISMYLFSNWTEEIYDRPVKANEPVPDNNMQTEIDPVAD